MKNIGTSRDKKMAESRSFHMEISVSLEALISIARFLVGNLKKIRGGSIQPKGRQEEGKDRIQKKMTETI